MNILIVTPHPDDETLGAGGYISRLADEYNDIFWLILTNIKKEYGWPESKVSERNNEINKISSFYNFKDTINYNLQPTYLDTYPRNELINKISETFKKIKPDIILIPWIGDAHSDHIIANQISLSSSKVFRHPYIKRILAMEIISETNYGTTSFKPNYYVNIDQYIDKKIEAMKIYQSELGTHPFPRSEEAIRSLATLRGSESNCTYAEAFSIIKWIE